MSDARTRDLVERYSLKESRSRLQGAGGMACIIFTAILGCAFWAGAVVASTPLPH